MDDFILIFRRDYQTADLQPTAEELQQQLKHWQEWFASLADNDMLSRPVQRLDTVGRIVGKDRSISNGPYRESRESIGGLVIAKAIDYDEAVEIAESCPILELGGNVEIRQGL